MLSAAINFWLLPANVFFDVFFPRAKAVAAPALAPVLAEPIPQAAYEVPVLDSPEPAPAAEPTPRKSKVVKSKRADRVAAIARIVSTSPDHTH
jgi:hypothetical protein